MPNKIDKTNPVIQRLVHADVDRALLSRGLDLESPVKAELLRRTEVLFGYHAQPLIRFRDDDQTLVPADTCLDHLLTQGQSIHNSAGPTRIPFTDREALFNVDIEKIARGQISVFDDRKHPR